MKFYLSMFSITLLMATAQAQVKNWQTVTIDDSKVSLSMPGKPTEETRTKSSIVGEVTSHIYTVQVPQDGSVTLDCSHLPGAATFFAGPDTIFDNAKGKYLSSVYGKADSWKSITYQGQQGMQLMFSTPPMNGNPGYDGEAQFFLVGNTLYIVAVMDKVGDDLEMGKKVFPSLTFTGS